VDLVSLAPEQVLGNPSAPEALLAAGSQLAATGLRAAVAGNPATPAPVLKRLARDSEADVLRAVVQHPRTPPKLRRQVIRRLGQLPR
jgi:hypothetical protein